MKSSNIARSYGFDLGQKLAIKSGSEVSKPILSNEVMLHATSDCVVMIGDDPVAADKGGVLPLSAGEKLHVRIKGGEKVAVRQIKSSGSLYILPVMN